MKSTLSKIAVMSTIAMAMLFTSCGEKDTAESLTDELVPKFDALAEAVGSAKDKESAEKAAKEIDTIGDEVLAIAERMKDLPEPSEDEKKRIEEKMKTANNGMQEKMTSAMTGLASDLEAFKIIGEAMVSFGQKVEKAQETFDKFGK